MKPLHTPGPWTSREPMPEPFLVRDGGREWLTFDWHIHGVGGQLIGLVEFNTSNKGCARVSSMEEARANMRLVVAAPELLAVVELIVDQVTDPANDGHTLGAFKFGARIAEARAAIAKARGAA